MAENLTPDQLADPDLTAPYADANGNGIENLTEYAVGGDQPLRLSSSLELVASLNSRATGVNVLIERSTDLVSWEVILTSTNGQAPNGTASYAETIQGDLREVLISVNAQNGRGFYRLRVLQL